MHIELISCNGNMVFVPITSLLIYNFLVSQTIQDGSQMLLLKHYSCTCMVIPCPLKCKGNCGSLGGRNTVLNTWWQLKDKLQELSFGSVHHHTGSPLSLAPTSDMV